MYSVAASTFFFFLGCLFQRFPAGPVQVVEEDGSRSTTFVAPSEEDGRNAENRKDYSAAGI
jgi:hypothetical protein